MAFTDFTLGNVAVDLGLTLHRGTVFSNLPETEVPAKLVDWLENGMNLALTSEKSRSEFIVAPVLLVVRELSGRRLSILSGERLDVDADRRLVGECDFILALSEALPVLQAPLMTIVEAKKNDIEAGLGQCIAQMVAAQVFNQRHRHAGAVFGCVTTGMDWQFLRLDGNTIVIETKRFFINDVASILAVFLAMIVEAGIVQPAAAAT